jgi:hypothetical protein
MSSTPIGDVTTQVEEKDSSLDLSEVPQTSPRANHADDEVTGEVSEVMEIVQPQTSLTKPPLKRHRDAAPTSSVPTTTSTPTLTPPTQAQTI